MKGKFEERSGLLLKSSARKSNGTRRGADTKSAVRGRRTSGSRSIAYSVSKIQKYSVGLGVLSDLKDWFPDVIARSRARARSYLCIIGRPQLYNLELEQ